MQCSFASIPCFAEEITLKDGSKFEYKKVVSVEDSGINFEVEHGQILIEWSQLKPEDIRNLGAEEKFSSLNKKLSPQIQIPAPEKSPKETEPTKITPEPKKDLFVITKKENLQQKSESSSNWLGSIFSTTLGAMGAITLGLIIYLIPTICAAGKKQSTSVFLVNIFLGWTFLGWVLALVWAVYGKKEIDNSKGKKKCPFCMELINSQAIVCPFCRKDIPKMGSIPIDKAYKDV